MYPAPDAELDAAMQTCGRNSSSINSRPAYAPRPCGRGAMANEVAAMAVAARRKRVDLGGWAFVAPALLWTAAFFVAPFIVMAVVSLWERIGSHLVATWSFANYLKFFERGHFLEAC